MIAEGQGSRRRSHYSAQQFREPWGPGLAAQHEWKGREGIKGIKGTEESKGQCSEVMGEGDALYKYHPGTPLWKNGLTPHLYLRPDRAALPLPRSRTCVSVCVSTRLLPIARA